MRRTQKRMLALALLLEYGVDASDATNDYLHRLMQFAGYRWSPTARGWRWLLVKVTEVGS